MATKKKYDSVSDTKVWAFKRFHVRPDLLSDSVDDVVMEQNKRELGCFSIEIVSRGRKTISHCIKKNVCT